MACDLYLTNAYRTKLLLSHLRNGYKNLRSARLPGLRGGSDERWVGALSVEAVDQPQGEYRDLCGSEHSAEIPFQKLRGVFKNLYTCFFQKAAAAFVCSHPWRDREQKGEGAEGPVGTGP